MLSSYFEKLALKTNVSALSVCIFTVLWLCVFVCVLQGPRLEVL